MKRLIVALLLMSFGSATAVHPAAAQRGTPEQAKSLLEKAQKHYNSVGRKAALADFNARKGQFIDRDLYVFCIGPDRKISANGGFPSLVGSAVDQVKDADGKPLGKALMDAAGKNQESVHYRWVNPVSRKTEPKTSFVRKVGADVCGVGVYTPEDAKE
jgi:cytochrome c